jgi:ABC-2 type transport system ATP-binding protein
LLDEVEKTCDQVAIVDLGVVVVQGAVGEIAAQGDPTLLIEIDDPAAARKVLGSEPRITHVEEEGASILRLTIGDGLLPADVNRALVSAGVAVSRLEPARATLEETFLTITSRLEEHE